MIASIRTEEDFKENFDFAYKALEFIKDIDIKGRARFFAISQRSKTNYMIHFKSYPFPGFSDYSFVIEATYSDNQWQISLLNKSVN